MVAQAGTDLAHAAPPQQIECGLPQERHDGRPLPTVDQAGVFPQHHILDVVQGMLNAPAVMHLKGNDCPVVQSSQS